MMQSGDISAGVYYSFETKKTLFGFRLKFTIESESGVQSYGIFVEVENYKTVGELTREISRRFNVKYSENLKVFIDEFEVPPEESIQVLIGVDSVKIRSNAISSQSEQNGDSGDLSVDREERQGNSKRSVDVTTRPNTGKKICPNRSVAVFLKRLNRDNHGARLAERVENEDTTCGVAKDSLSVHCLAGFYEQLANKSNDSETSIVYPVENANQNDSTMELDEQCDLSSSGMQSSQISSAHEYGAVENVEGTDSSLERARRKRKRKHSKKKKESVAVDEVDREPNILLYKRAFPAPCGTGKHTFFDDSDEPAELYPTEIHRKDINGIIPRNKEPKDLDPTDIYKKDVNGTVPGRRSPQDLDPTGLYKKDVNEDVNGTVPGRRSPQDLDPTGLYKKDVNEDVNGTVPGRGSPQDLDLPYSNRENPSGSQELPVHTSKPCCVDQEDVSEKIRRSKEPQDFEPTYASTKIVKKGNITSTVSLKAKRKKSGTDFHCTEMNYSCPVPKPRMALNADEQLGQLLMLRDLKTFDHYNVEFGEDFETESSSANSSTDPNKKVSVTEKNSLVPKSDEETFTKEVSTMEKPKSKVSDVLRVIHGVIEYNCSNEWKELTEENAFKDLTSVTRPEEKQIIAFRVLYLDRNCQPQPSQFILGKVVKSTTQTVCLEIQPYSVTTITELNGDLPDGIFHVENNVYELEWTAVRDSLLMYPRSS